MALSRDRSETIFLSRLFSSSSCRSNFISEGIRPAYFFRQLKYVAWLIPASRQISATGTPSSPRFTMNAFCASENFDAFIYSAPSQPGSQRGQHQSKTIQFLAIRAVRRRQNTLGPRMRIIRGKTGRVLFCGTAATRQIAQSHRTS